jgi:hypothetical protein
MADPPDPAATVRRCYEVVAGARGHETFGLLQAASRCRDAASQSRLR